MTTNLNMNELSGERIRSRRPPSVPARRGNLGKPMWSERLPLHCFISPGFTRDWTERASSRPLRGTGRINNGCGGSDHSTHSGVIRKLQQRHNIPLVSRLKRWPFGSRWGWSTTQATLPLVIRLPDVITTSLLSDKGPSRGADKTATGQGSVIEVVHTNTEKVLLKTAINERSSRKLATNTVTFENM